MGSQIEQLQALFKQGQVSTSPSVLEQHGRDKNYPEVRPPLSVVYAETKEDIQTVLSWCSTQQIPLIPFGVGISLEGALVPAQADVPIISLDLSRMNRVVSIQPENFLAVVQPVLISCGCLRVNVDRFSEPGSASSGTSGWPVMFLR